MRKNKSSKQKLFKAAMAASLVTGAVVMVAPAVADAAVKFKDVNASSVYYDSIMELADRGVIDGFKDGTFKPYTSVTRGQAAKIIANALDLDTSKVKDPGFKDVSKSNQFYGSIAALIEQGIITGYKDDTYRPNDTLTRSQMAKIISIAFDLPEEKTASINFTDVNDSHWYKGFVQTLVKHNVTKGITATLFSPDQAVDRGQIATFVVRAEKAVNNAEEITSVTDASITVTSGTYKISTELQKVLNASNASALAGAKLKFTAKDGEITAVQSLTITKSNVTVDGAGASFAGSIVVAGESVQLKNISIEGNLTITNAVKTAFNGTDITVKGITEVAAKASAVKAAATTSALITFTNAKLGQVNASEPSYTVELKGTTTLTGVSISANNTTIKADTTVTIPSLTISGAVTQVNIDVQGTIGTLTITNDNTTVTVGANTTITNLVLPTGTNPADVIPNYEEIKDQIKNIDGEPVVPTPPAPGPGIITPAGNAPLQAELDIETDRIKAQVASIVDIDLEGNTFTVDILKENATFVDFKVVAQPIFDVFKNKVVVNTADVTITYPSGASANIPDNSVKNYTNLEDILKAALLKVGMKETDSIEFLKGAKVTYKITGAYNNQPVDTTYTFNFAK